MGSFLQGGIFPISFLFRGTGGNLVSEIHIGLEGAFGACL